MATKDEGKDNKTQGFFVDIMLGTLATHLRALGFDTEVGRITCQRLLSDRVLISRNRRLKDKCKNVIVLSSEKLEEQMRELNHLINIKPIPAALFSRCLRCNSKLVTAPEEALESVPEYIKVIHQDNIRFCEMCKKCFWPGTHRQHMEKKFKSWGLI